MVLEVKLAVMTAIPVSAPPRLRRRLRDWLALTPLPEAAGWVTGRTLASLPLLPGLAGSLMVSLGSGEFAGHVFGHGLTPWVAVVVGGAFALRLDWRI